MTSADETASAEQQAGNILRRNCYRCHKGQGSESGYAFDVMDIKSLIDEGMIVADEPESSEVFNALFSGRMPPRNRPQLPRPSPEDAAIVEKWIADGAMPIPVAQQRPVISLTEQLQVTLKHLQESPRETRSGLRYISLANLWNDITVDEEQLRTTRLALSKTLNSLSWESRLVKPESVNESQTIFAINLDDLGWTREHWNTLAAAYPYALSYGSLDGLEPDNLEKEIQGLRGSDQTLSVLRADWLISVATKPPLYYSLLFDLHLPQLQSRRPNHATPRNPLQMKDIDLEMHLGVTASNNISRGKVWRSGFTESGVSGQNRLIERHDSKSGGFYWKSYDFKSSNRTAILTEFPLGPNYEGNPFGELAFDHDGGEIIFELPNGLQGYLLIDADGNRIDAGPIEVVGDSLKTSGNEQIVAGVSCIACHRHGMIESPDDEIRQFTGVVGGAREHVLRLYPENDRFRETLDRDRRPFMAALAEMFEDLAEDVSIEDMPEPVGEVARRYYLEPMSIATVASEMHISTDRLRTSLKADPQLRALGLRVLLREGGTIKRAAWESPAAFPLMKATARQFGYDPR